MGCGGSKGTDPVEAKEEKPKSNVNDQSKVNNNNNNTNNNANDKTKANSQSNGYSTNSSPRRPGGHPYPQSKYAASSHNGSVYEEGQESKTDKGYKRRIRKELQQATKGTDIEALEKTREKFLKNRIEDDGDLTRADERLDYLHLKRDLRDSIRRSHVGVLEKTIAEAKASRYASDLGPQIEAAERKLEHLRELNKYSHDILAMDQSTISEIHSYHRPPACVHDVMAASYMLLGHEEQTLRDWSYVQSIAGRVGNEALIKQVKNFDSKDVDHRTATRVREILDYHELDEVRVASNGAATFHVWSSNIADKIIRDGGNEDTPDADGTPVDGEQHRGQDRERQEGGRKASESVVRGRGGEKAPRGGSQQSKKFQEKQKVEAKTR